MKIGARIYYSTLNGEILTVVHEREGFVRETTVEEDIATFNVLHERARDSFDYIQLNFGDYSADFERASKFKVNLETKGLEFTYLSEVEQEVFVEESLTQKLLRIEEENADLLIDSVIKDIRIEQNETDIADLLLVIGGM